MIKLIAADMDGTLISSNGEISKENIKAIKEAQGREIKFAIATGRALCDVASMLKKYDLKCDTLIMNGAQYLDEDGNIISSTYIDKSKVKDILKAMEHDDICIEIYTDEGFFSADTKEKVLMGMIRRGRVFHPEIKTFEELKAKAEENIHYINMKYINDMNDFIENNNIAKFISFSHDEELIKTIRKRVDNIGGLAVSGSFSTNVEVNDINAEKGKILLEAGKRYNIKREEIAILGDGMNDYSMFKEFPCSFAMSNAVPEIKKVAKYITSSNNENGVAKAIYKIINENL
ncbi:MAG: HAD family phosphatase [Clostridium sp.]|nr:HAD family phosphatase [Clostridium sp.]